jgi:GR25 family glycosyltransferase involved in LPS biosynthesis
MYLIHGIDPSREPRMIYEFIKAGIDTSAVQWIRHPNKDEITYQFLNTYIMKTPSYIATQYIPGGPNSISRGVASCTYKHYLALEDIVKNKYEYSIIMEDNMQFVNGINIPERVNLYIEQLNTFYPDWDVLFDMSSDTRSDYHTYTADRVVYPRKLVYDNPWHGGSRCARFYLLRYKCAEALYNNYIPFNSPPDMWMNDLFRRLDMKVFWAEPNAVEDWHHSSTAT